MTVTHSGFAVILGRPNVGKSSLMNKMLGEKAAIVSSKPQTTRSREAGVLTTGNTQIVFLDTPGVHRARNRLGEVMLREVNDSIDGADAAVLVVEPSADPNETELGLIEKLKKSGIKTILAINKIDSVVKKEALMPVIAAWADKMNFTAVVPLSAKTGSGVEELVKELSSLMGEGPWYYPADSYTDRTERDLAAEIIREKLLWLLSDEVPHGIAVKVEKMRERPDGGIVDVEASIYCEKESHKGIVIGKNGSVLKKVGSMARKEIEQMTGGQVNLKLWVKVLEGWRDSEKDLKALGFTAEAKDDGKK